MLLCKFPTSIRAVWRKILKEWFKDEEAFIKKIVPLLSEKDGKVKKPEPKNTTIDEVSYDKKVFTEPRGWLIFEAFKNEVVNEDSEYADYSFLYASMLKDNLIFKGQKKFIQYLSDNHGSKILSNGYIQFKYSNTPAKVKAYKRLKRQFQ